MFCKFTSFWLSSQTNRKYLENLLYSTGGLRFRFFAFLFLFPFAGLERNNWMSPLSRSMNSSSNCCEFCLIESFVSFQIRCTRKIKLTFSQTQFQFLFSSLLLLFVIRRKVFRIFLIRILILFSLVVAHTSMNIACGTNNNGKFQKNGGRKKSSVWFSHRRSSTTAKPNRHQAMMRLGKIVSQWIFLLVCLDGWMNSLARLFTYYTVYTATTTATAKKVTHIREKECFYQMKYTTKQDGCMHTPSPPPLPPIQPTTTITN